MGKIELLGLLGIGMCVHVCSCACTCGVCSNKVAFLICGKRGKATVIFMGCANPFFFFFSFPFIWYPFYVIRFYFLKLMLCRLGERSTIKKPRHPSWVNLFLSRAYIFPSLRSCPCISLTIGANRRCRSSYSPAFVFPLLSSHSIYSDV